MEKKIFQKVQLALATLLAMLWVSAVIYSFICMPDDMCRDRFDNVLEEHIVANYGENVAVLYSPLSWLIEPHKDGVMSITNGITVMVCLFLCVGAIMLVKKADEPGPHKYWLWFPMVVLFDAYLLSYLLLGLF